jgi:hypothetical protein
LVNSFRRKLRLSTIYSGVFDSYDCMITLTASQVTRWNTPS